MFTQGWSLARPGDTKLSAHTWSTCPSLGLALWAGDTLSVPCPFLGHQGTARVWGADILLRSEVWSHWRPKESAVPWEQGLCRLCDSEVQLSQPPWLLLRWEQLRHRGGIRSPSSHGAQAPRLPHGEKGLCAPLRRKRKLWCGKSSSKVPTHGNTVREKKTSKKKHIKVQEDGTIPSGSP